MKIRNPDERIISMGVIIKGAHFLINELELFFKRKIKKKFLGFFMFKKITFDFEF
jgi:hypothetical protein